jgi:hypothetical protein
MQWMSRNLSMLESNELFLTSHFYLMLSDGMISMRNASECQEGSHVTYFRDV